MCIVINLIINLILFSKRGHCINWTAAGWFHGWAQCKLEAFVLTTTVGSLTLHNAFKAGISMWNVDKILKACTLFSTMILQGGRTMNKSRNLHCFSSHFVATGGLKISQLLNGLWQSGHLSWCMWTLCTKNSSQKPKTASFDTIETAIKDPLTTVKMHFFMTVARTSMIC